jgi:hypothetical protein
LVVEVAGYDAFDLEIFVVYEFAGDDASSAGEVEDLDFALLVDVGQFEHLDARRSGDALIGCYYCLCWRVHDGGNVCD